MSTEINDGFNHSIQHFSVGQRVTLDWSCAGSRITYACTISRIEPSVGGWIYVLVSEEGLPGEVTAFGNEIKAAA